MKKRFFFSFCYRIIIANKICLRKGGHFFEYSHFLVSFWALWWASSPSDKLFNDAMATSSMWCGRPPNHCTHVESVDVATPSGGWTILPGQAGWPRAAPQTNSSTQNEEVVDDNKAGGDFDGDGNDSGGGDWCAGDDGGGGVGCLGSDGSGDATSTTVLVAVDFFNVLLMCCCCFGGVVVVLSNLCEFVLFIISIFYMAKYSQFYFPMNVMRCIY